MLKVVCNACAYARQRAKSGASQESSRSGPKNGDKARSQDASCKTCRCNAFSNDTPQSRQTELSCKSVSGKASQGTSAKASRKLCSPCCRSSKGTLLTSPHCGFSQTFGGGLWAS